MAIAVDASTPARWHGTPVSGAGISSTSFTAPSGALLVVCLSADDNALAVASWTLSDSGGLAWTKQVERTTTETTAGGNSSVYTAKTTSAVSRTVTATAAAGNTSSKRVSCACYVVTGQDATTPLDTVGASNEGGSGTNNLTTTSITAGANGLLICCDTDWNQLGVFTSSDLTIDTADYAGAISVCSGYKTVTSGASVNGNLNAGGTATAQHKWVQVVVREAASAAPVYVPNVFPEAFQDAWRPVPY